MSFNTFLQEGQNEDKAKSLLKKAEKDDVYDDLLSITSPYKQDQHGKNNKHLPKLVDFYLNGTSLDHIKFYYDKFIKNTKIAQRPIDSLNFHDFEQLVDSSVEQVKDVKSDEEIKDNPFYEDDKVKIYKGTNKEQCVRYGKGKKYGFCISRSDHSNLFHGYRGRGATFYFVYFKEPQKNCPTDLIVLQAYPNDTYQINYAKPNQDHEISKEEIKSKFPDLDGAIDQLVYVPHDEKEKRIYDVVEKARSITDLKTLDDQLLWVEMGKRIKNADWNDLINQEEIVKKYIETGVGDIPSDVLSKYPKYQSRYDDKLKQRIGMKIDHYTAGHDDHEINWTADELEYGLKYDIIDEKYIDWGSLPGNITIKDLSLIKSNIATHPEAAYRYAKNLKKRWLEAEPYIAKDPEFASYYVQDVINKNTPKDQPGIRWTEAEPYILNYKDLRYAQNYARNIIKGRWPELEKRILHSKLETLNDYTLIDNPDARRYSNIIEYVEKILKRRWPEAERFLFNRNDARYLIDYAEATNQRLPIEIEKRILLDNKYHQNNLTHYAKRVIGSRWVDGEKMMIEMIKDKNIKQTDRNDLISELLDYLKSFDITVGIPELDDYLTDRDWIGAYYKSFNNNKNPRIEEKIKNNPELVKRYRDIVDPDFNPNKEKSVNESSIKTKIRQILFI